LSPPCSQYAVKQVLVIDVMMYRSQITLSRDTIDISGHGQLTLGKLPDGVDNSSLTWVPVRLYSSDEGGLRSPTFAPNEVYPLYVLLYCVPRKLARNRC